jgi:hypothetical protein
MKILLDFQNGMRAVTLNSPFSLCGLKYAGYTEVKIRILECPDIQQHIHNFVRTSVNFVLPLYIYLNFEYT